MRGDTTETSNLDRILQQIQIQNSNPSSFPPSDMSTRTDIGLLQPQKKTLPWWNFSNLPVWETTLPGTPKQAAYHLTELAKDVSPVVGPYRSAVRSGIETERAKGLLQEGKYIEAISPTIWSGLESLDASFSALPVLGAAATLPIDLARTAKNTLFSSPAQKAVSEVSQEALPGQQWLKQLEGRGVKKDELEWTGLLNFLKEKKGNIPKSEVDDFIEANKIDVREVQYKKGVVTDEQDLAIRASVADEMDLLVQNDEGLYNMRDEILPLIRGYRSNEMLTGDLARLDEYFENYTMGGQHGSYTDDFYEEIKGQWNLDDTTKHPQSHLQLPGGDNYKELLLTLPSKNRNTVKRYEELMDISARRNLTDAESEEMVAIERQQFGGESGILGPSKDFISGHFDEPNIIAHVRFNERITPEGESMLFIEEMQSDWAHAGLERGFEDTGLKGYLNSLSPKNREIVERMLRKGRENPEVLTSGVFDKDWQTLSKTQPELEHNIIHDTVDNSPDIRGGIPRAPFVTDTHQWTNLGLKRMIKYAADNGFDSIAWTTGKQQGERYHRLKSVGSINFKKKGDKWDVRAFEGTDDAARMNIEDISIADGKREFTEAELRKTFGDGVADEIIADTERLSDKWDDPTVSAAILNIQEKFGNVEVGGEYGKFIYDKVMTEQAKKIGKKHGAKVEQTNLHEVELRPVIGDHSRWKIMDQEDEYFVDPATNQIMSYSSKEQATDVIDKAQKGVKVWTMKLTDKLMKAAKEGLPYYALVPPGLLAAGAQREQRERQSLLE